MNVILRCLDLETSGMAPPKEVIEIGICDVIYNTETKEVRIEPQPSALFGVGEPMGPEVIAVHHITNKAIEGLPICTVEDMQHVVNWRQPFCLIAHNRDFEAKWFTPEVMGETRLACTYKAALRIWPDAPVHSNQGLRYWLDLDLDDAMASPPHRGGPDAYVTAHIVARMLQTHRVQDIVRFTLEPRAFPICPLTKHRGPWEDVPHDFLSWMAFKAADLDPDLKHAAKVEMDRRREAKGARP
jgi:exodeoxyribonuclease X